jgi:hypothetical protein
VEVRRASNCHPERAAVFAANEGPQSAKPSLASPPPPVFSTFIANKALIQFDAWASLAPRLGGPWATQGSPKPKPNPNEPPFSRRFCA